MKKNWKTVLAFLLVMVLCCGLCGCAGNMDKEQALALYNDAISHFGEMPLTADAGLAGKRSFGEDKYTGSYSADYEGYSKTEYLFGGTSLEREGGDKIDVSCNMTVVGGTAKLFVVSGDSEPEVLLETAGEYSHTFTIPQGSWYIGFAGSGFTGSLELFLSGNAEGE